MENILEGKLITKEKRHEIFGKVAGGKGSIEPENYQRKMIEECTKIECKKTNTRINLRNYSLHNISCPNKTEDGFDYSENFDGCQSVKDNSIYINLKCIVGKGGAQTRSLREVYWFIEGQLRSLYTLDNVYFVNILDGDEAHRNMQKYDYLLEKFADVKHKVYVGDLRQYFDWFEKTFADK